MSAIDVTKPIYGSPTTKSVRDNFVVAASEIDTANSAIADLQTAVDGLLPLSGGTMTGYLALSGDPVLPLQATPRQYVDNNFLNLSGGTLTGPLVLAADPAANLNPATKQYVDSRVTIPSIGKNYIHNGLFNVKQRGSGPWTTGVYTADRWLAQLVTDTISYTVGTFADAQRTQIGDEEANSYLQNTFTGNAAAGACNYLHQRIENVRRLAGKTVTVSFWAGASAGTPKIGINILQSFGTGGSPSAMVRALATGASVTIGTVWNRYQATIAIPSIVGKTLGSNNNDYTALEFWFSSGATFNAVAGNIGVQSAAIALWGVQVEVGSSATLLEKLGASDDLARCQRFYQLGQVLYAGYGTTGITLYQTVSLPVIMRATPAITPFDLGSVNVTSPTVVNAGNQGNAAAVGSGTLTGSGGFMLNCSYLATADL